MKRAAVFVLSFIAMVAILSPIGTYAQYGKRHQNLLSISPFGLVNKVRIGYERSLGKRVSAGVNGSFYYDTDFPGFQVAPFLRYYFNLEHHAGWYLHFNYVYFDHFAQVTEKNTLTTGASGKLLYDLEFKGNGGGVGLGYQMLLGKKKNIGLDFMGGLKHLPIPTDEPFRRPQSESLKSEWILMGPGSFFNGKIGLSYVF